MKARTSNRHSLESVSDANTDNKSVVEDAISIDNKNKRKVS